MSIVKLVDFILEQSDKRAQAKKTKQREAEQKQALRQREKAAADFSARARSLQPKFENSEFCDLITKFVLDNYYVTTDTYHYIALYEHSICINPGKSLKFRSLKYQSLKGGIELMACAYAIQSKLKQHWPKDTIITLDYKNGGGYDDSSVWIHAFKNEELKKVY